MCIFTDDLILFFVKVKSNSPARPASTEGLMFPRYWIVFQPLFCPFYCPLLSPLSGRFIVYLYCKLCLVGPRRDGPIGPETCVPYRQTFNSSTISSSLCFCGSGWHFLQYLSKNPTNLERKSRDQPASQACLVLANFFLGLIIGQVWDKVFLNRANEAGLFEKAYLRGGHNSSLS